MCSSMGRSLSKCLICKVGDGEPHRAKAIQIMFICPDLGGEILSKEQASGRMLWTPGRFSSAGVGREDSEGSVRTAEGLL